MVSICRIASGSAKPGLPKASNASSSASSRKRSSFGVDSRPLNPCRCNRTRKLMPEHWGLEDGDIPCLGLEFLRTGEIERPLRGDDMGQDIQHPGFFFDLLADLREKALDIVDRQREHTEIAGAVHVAPSAQELSRFAHGARRQGRRSVTVSARSFFAENSVPSSLRT